MRASPRIWQPSAPPRAPTLRNGAVTFLVDGMVAGTWDAPLRGLPVLTLTPLGPITANDRGEVETEGDRLLVWLRPDTDRREVRWTTANE